jgi:hypothetical protein
LAKKSNDESVTGNKPRSRLDASAGVAVGVLSGIVIWLIVGALVWLLRP